MTEKMKELLKQVRKEIENTTDWNELYGLGEELEILSSQAEDQLDELHKKEQG